MYISSRQQCVIAKTDEEIKGDSSKSTTLKLSGQWCIIHRWSNLTSSYLPVCCGTMLPLFFTPVLSPALLQEREESNFHFCSLGHISIHFFPCGSERERERGDNWGPHQIGLKKRVRRSRTDLGRGRRGRGGVQRKDRETVGPWNTSLRPGTGFLCSTSEPVIRWYLSVLVKSALILLYSSHQNPQKAHRLTRVRLSQRLLSDVQEVTFCSHNLTS